MTVCAGSTALPAPAGIWANLSHEGYRLFFPVAAIYASFWPLFWVVAYQFDLPLAVSTPPSFSHGYEMLVGAFGAALIGFLVTAVPEWTDSPKPRGRMLWAMLFTWGGGRIFGCLGWDNFGIAGGIADAIWIVVLLLWLTTLTVTHCTDGLLAFVFWLIIVLISISITRGAFFFEMMEFAETGVSLIGLSFLGLLGLALSRITVPITNLVLDPTEKTSPFRPHPGRLHLAPGMVVIAWLGVLIGASDDIVGFLLLACGAAFLDRIAEGFIGRAFMRTEILLLMGASAMAGVGLGLIGFAKLGAEWSELAGRHIAFMGGLGLGTYAVFCVATRLHSGRSLHVLFGARIGAICLTMAVFARIASDFGFPTVGAGHGLTLSLWAAGFVLWARSYGPILIAPEVIETTPAMDSDAGQPVAQAMPQCKDSI